MHSNCGWSTWYSDLVCTGTLPIQAPPAIHETVLSNSRNGFPWLCWCRVSDLSLYITACPLPRPAISGLLKRALARASCGQGLKYLHLRTNVDTYEDDIDWYVPLTTIFTPTSFSRLEHFGFARFYVEQDDLLELLASLPKTLRSVELSEIQFMDSKDSYRTLLWAIRDTLDWKERNPRPTLVVSTDLPNPNPGRAIWLEHELYSFLYEDGSNPETRAPRIIRFGFGWEKDCSDPDHKRPHVDSYDLADMGYIKHSSPNPTSWRPMQRSPKPGCNWLSSDARYLM